MYHWNFFLIGWLNLYTSFINLEFWNNIFIEPGIQCMLEWSEDAGAQIVLMGVDGIQTYVQNYRNMS